MEYQKILDDINAELKRESFGGKVANYIPELAQVDPDKFGIHLSTLDNGDYFIGCNKERFSIQSISKVFALTMAYPMLGEKLWKRVGVEPSGNPFNSLVQLEYESGIPRNPLINAGALVVSDVLVSNLKNPKHDFLRFVQKLAGNSTISYNEKVAESEKDTGYRNVALASLMKSFGNIENLVEEVLDFYFYMCSIEMSCKELSQTFLLYANHGKHFVSKERILNASQSKRLSAILLTCGFYDQAGEFTFKVGLPGKSGVGGGIAAVFPEHYSVAVWSPKLNKAGNSVLGMEVLERLTTKTGLSIF
ncbi:MAG TPA: glutaminase [Balneola sp.]|jgi:glutaminase|nr:glutaminase [Bacteroidota bacterium]MAC05558.1 glutaminase [Balneola sp.]MAO76659.1 glutaminase [Balneola sp.]MBF65066.1 glutaminase [Balneola sp.]HAH52224.1 glutaminase [Balneola sp.]|tara:strand:+ start:6286 stop:7200 length:915 start_codon:yes stop_codon:yes gene_type:complete